MKKKKLIAVTSISAVLILFLGAAFAAKKQGCEWHHGGGPGMGFRLDDSRVTRMMERLELDTQQRDQIWALIDDRRQAIRTEKEALRENRKKLRKMDIGKLSDKQIKTFSDTQGQIIANLIALRLEIRNGIQALLTPEQQEQMKKMRKGKHSHGGNRHSHDREFGSLPVEGGYSARLSY